MARILLIISLFLVNCLHSFAQHINFSQYHHTPFNVNPGMIASSDDISVTFSHRNQQYSSDLQLQSSVLTATFPLLYRKSGYRWGAVGISAINDESNSVDILKTQGISGTVAYNLHFTRFSYLSLGIQGGYFQRRFSDDGIETGNQFDPINGYDPSIGTGYSFKEDLTNYFTISSGLMWYDVDRDFRKNRYVGVAMYNMNKPAESFSAKDFTIPYRYVFTAGYRIYHTRRFGISPEILYVVQGKRDFVNVGSIFSYYFDKKIDSDIIKPGSVDFGAKYILNRSAVLSIQFNQPGLTMGFSYDISTATSSNISPVSGATEFAISLRKNIGFNKNKHKVVVVKDHTVGQVRDFYKEQTLSKSETEDNSAKGESKPRTKLEKPVRFELKRDFKFAFNDATINDADKPFLDDIAKLLLADQTLQLEIIAHTDNIGSNAQNQEVSNRRANSVIEYLVEKGITKERLTGMGRGEMEPLYPNNTDENRAKNRRVEFIIYRD
jgi:type IX secretion system PorP/SprF family membrane protein